MSDVKELQEYQRQEQPVDARPQWVGTPPAKCDLCGRRITDVFTDGRIRGRSSWACMGHCCFTTNGVGLGTGRGQMYRLQPNGTYRKVGG